MVFDDFASVEASILELYKPSQPKEILNVLQKQLQDVQRTLGWALADALLQSQHESVRFFAALTFQVKLNQDGASLSEEQQLDILSKLLDWIVRLIAASESLVVIRKLCSVLSTFYYLPNCPWTRCIRHLVCCMADGRFIPETSIDQFPPTDELLQKLPQTDHINAILQFTNTIAEDAMRVDGANQHIEKSRERVNQNVDDVFVLLQLCLSDALQTKIESFSGDILPCYLSWIAYFREAYTPPCRELSTVRSFLPTAASWLSRSDRYDTAVEFFIDLFTTYEELLEMEDYSHFATILDSPWAEQHLRKLQGAPDEHENLMFGQLALAYGQAASKILNDYPNDTQQLMNLMHEITKTQNHETIDQSLSNAIMDFWETFTARASKPDTDSPPQKQHNFASAKANWLQAIEELCVGTALPVLPQGTDFRTGTADGELSEFRARVVDAVQTSYADFDAAILQKLVSQAVEFYSESRSPHNTTQVSASNLDYDMTALARVESTLNCLKGLADSLYYDSDCLETEDGELQKLFGSRMYTDLTNMTIKVPMKLRKTAVNIIAECDNFLSRFDQYLLSALDVLLRCLEHSVLTTVAARAIWTLCDSSRTKLPSMLDHFLTVCDRFLDFDGADPQSREYVLGATAAIIQALPSEAQQMAALERLLVLIERCHSSPRARAEKNKIESNGNGNGNNTDEVEGPEATTLDTLALLASVGSALCTPDDAPIDLEDDEIDGSRPDFSNVQLKILQFLRALLDPFRHNGPVVEAVCRVLRCGFRELRPGPFVFDGKSVINVLVSIPITNARVDFVLTTGGNLIMSRSSKPTTLAEHLPGLLVYACQAITYTTEDFIPTATGPTATSSANDPLTSAGARRGNGDPEILSAAMELFKRLVPAFIGHLLFSLPGELATQPFYTSLHILAGADILPKRAAAELWSSLLSLTLPPETPANISTAHAEVLLRFGPLLTATLVSNFSGKVARSELDFLTEPFRRLVSRFPREMKGWIEAAWTAETGTGIAETRTGTVSGTGTGIGTGMEIGAGPNVGAQVAARASRPAPGQSKVGENEQRKFVAQVLHLRGDKRQTVKVVKEFWAAARGVPVGYYT